MKTLLHDIFEQSVEFLSQHDVFYGHGVELAEDEVVLLLMYVLQVDFDTLNKMSAQSVEAPQREQIQQLLTQRVVEKIPMVYLVGFAVFAGLKFKVDERVLIPRSPFVELIDTGFEPWMDLADPNHVMDLCTGSGCIGLAIAHYFTGCTVDLVDLSQTALQLAKENTEILGLTNRVQCIESDLFSAINSQTNRCYDLIVANPPYVAEEEYQKL
ncbi:Ribosomal protein L3 N(5)-glutamine methyltransferase, partial [hydrothermal vent metagenome]